MPRPPLPPEELRYRVAGTPDGAWFEECGARTVSDFEDALALAGHTFRDFRDVYDFGCGCGRVTRWLGEKAPQARLHGSDIDEPAIEWMRRHMPDVDSQVNRGLPPLPFEDGAFDLVLGLSVFTHLNEHYQDQWLQELRRVTRPGALLLLSFHGDYHWDVTTEHYPGMIPRQPELDRAGIMYTRDDEWAGHFPDFYHTSWHRPWYVRSHWSRWFVVLGMVPEKGRPQQRQDIAVLLRAGDAPEAIEDLRSRFLGRLEGGARTRFTPPRQDLEAAFDDHAAHRTRTLPVRDAVLATVPEGAALLVVSRGDAELLRLGARTASHFPQVDDGVYAGHHPADSAEAIAHLEDLRAKGARFLVLPATAFWWRDQYPEFFEHLERHYGLARHDRHCDIFALSPDKGVGQARDLADGATRTATEAAAR